MDCSGATFPEISLDDLLDVDFLTDDFFTAGYEFGNELNATGVDTLNGFTEADPLPPLSADVIDAVFADEPEKVRIEIVEQQTSTDSRPFLEFVDSMSAMVHEDTATTTTTILEEKTEKPPLKPKENKTEKPPAEPKEKFPRAAMATDQSRASSPFTPPDVCPVTAPPPLDAFSQSVVNGLVAFRSCHNLHRARHQFADLSHRAFFPPSLQTIFDFHRGLTFVSSLAEVLPALVFLNELPNFPPVGPTILVLEGNSGTVIEPAWMWRSGLCPFVQCKCENQNLIPEAKRERRREQTEALVWLYQTENMICDTLIMMLILKQITGGQLANCDRCYSTSSPPFSNIAAIVSRVNSHGNPRRNPAFKKTRISEGPLRVYIQNEYITDVWYLRSRCRTGLPASLLTPLRW